MKVVNNNKNSVVSCCMDRNENLYNALKSWLRNKDVSEIIIVDWGSKTPVYDFISNNFPLDLIKIYRVENVHRWVLTWAYNLAIQKTSFNKILKLDSDIIISKDFFTKYKLNKNNFFRGSWEIARDENENHLNGQFYGFKDDLFEINLYNEKIVSYGWDDDDLYSRLKKTGLKEEFINPKDIFHIPHDDKKRVLNQSEFSNIKNSDLKGAIDYKIWKNKEFSKTLYWDKSNSLKKWSTKAVSKNYFISKIIN